MRSTRLQLCAPSKNSLKRRTLPFFGKRRLDDIGFPIDAGGFSGACGKHHLQQRLQYLLQSFAAVLAGGLRIEAGYVAAAARSTLKFHGSS
jgi:hypothetical protein